MGSKNILLVEDNPKDEALALRVLRKHNIGHEIAVARDGAEAIEYLLGRGATSDTPLPQLVLLDMKLPKLDGLEVLSRIRANERTRSLAVVMFTSSKEETDIAASYRLGANSYVRKPVDFVEFADAVRQLGLYWLVLNEPSPPAGQS